LFTFAHSHFAVFFFATTVAKEPKAPPPEYGSITPVVKGFSDGVAPIKGTYLAMVSDDRKVCTDNNLISVSVPLFPLWITVAKDATPPKQVSSNLDADVKGFNDGVAPVKGRPR